MKIDFFELLNDLEKPVGLVQFFDFFFELELLQNPARISGKSGNILAQIGREIVGIIRKLGEHAFFAFSKGKPADIEKVDLELTADDFFDGLVIVFIGSF